MIKILLGGSPCTYWSVAKKNGRETQPSGMGWELFLNYKIALKKFKPDFFFYENNESAAEPIKAQISKELGVPLFHTNSSFVSAQMRRRIYAFNWQCDQPAEWGVMLKDIIITRDYYNGQSFDCYPVGMGYRNRREADGKLYRRFETSRVQKANALTTVETDSMIIEPYIQQNTDLFDIKELTEIQNKTYRHKGRMYHMDLPDGTYMFRHFTQTEAERLQTLPDGYTAAVSKTAARKALGNGWTADLIIYILSAGLINVDRMEKIVVLSMYDGIGTGRYCLDKLGFVNVTYYAYEIEPAAIKIALDNYPDIIELGDAFCVRDNAWCL